MDKGLTNTELKKFLSKKLEGLRKHSGQTIEATADSLDMAVSEYFRFLKGQRLPHLLTLLRLSKKYGVTLDWWFNELDALPGNKVAFRQKTFELRVLSLLKKFPPPAQNAALDVLAALAKNLLNTSLPAPRSRQGAYT
ncbi:MAG: helix-turn-helix domain-containing protein [Candidatus Margulisbacteria bacterium]|jgi:transcriptional regulator with XRE-family HTH domain|nr:helix-turn-helix domain-containing protein [Candidatus Margulisiibacteriota bacterium]